MTFKKIMAGAALAGSLAMLGGTANAAILDAWQVMNESGTDTDIGHLVVSGGQATIDQELNAAGNIFAGARFTEFGGLFSITYTPESCTGACDSGSPGTLSDLLSIEFAGLTGSITSVGGAGEFGFSFNPGVGMITLRDDSSNNILATLGIAAPSGGTLANFFGAANTSGTSNIFAQVLTSAPGYFKDSSGASLDTEIAAGNFFLALDTTNQIFTPASGIPCPAGLAGAAQCSQLVVTSQGKVDALVNAVPEPASLALVGMGLVGLAGLRKRKSVA